MKTWIWILIIVAVAAIAFGVSYLTWGVKVENSIGGAQRVGQIDTSLKATK